MVLKTQFYIKKIHTKISRLIHKIKLWHIANKHERKYQNYLYLQLSRTLEKKRKVTGLRSTFLLDCIIRNISNNRDVKVLCIGCRDTSELNYFKNHGFLDVVGIDLYSETSEILVMDMHEMRFSDNSFDIIYSCHSLEHSYNVFQVANEIIRVSKSNAIIAIEVPVRYETRGADIVDLENLEGLHNLFQQNIKNKIFSEEQAPKTTRNDANNTIIRSVFAISKR